MGVQSKVTRFPVVSGKTAPAVQRSYEDASCPPRRCEVVVRVLARRHLRNGSIAVSMPVNCLHPMASAARHELATVRRLVVSRDYYGGRPTDPGTIGRASH